MLGYWRVERLFISGCLSDYTFLSFERCYIHKRCPVPLGWLRGSRSLSTRRFNDYKWYTRWASSIILEFSAKGVVDNNTNHWDIANIQVNIFIGEHPNMIPLFLTFTCRWSSKLPRIMVVSLCPFSCWLHPLVFASVSSCLAPIVLLLSSGWWFGTCFIFPNSWDDDPIWRTHIFQRGTIW